MRAGTVCLCTTQALLLPGRSWGGQALAGMTATPSGTLGGNLAGLDVYYDDTDDFLACVFTVYAQAWHLFFLCLLYLF
jgi:hypothetical protein